MKFRFTHVEVIDRFKKIIKREEERINLIDQEISSISKLQDDNPTMLSKTLKQRRKEYKKTVDRYTIFGDHLIGNDNDPESIDLELSEMETLGIIENRF
jgi:septation ring formation regulator EzrA